MSFRDIATSHHVPYFWSSYLLKRLFLLNCSSFSTFLDYDAGRVYYQHRLISEWVAKEYRWSFRDLNHGVTTKLDLRERYWIAIDNGLLFKFSVFIELIFFLLYLWIILFLSQWICVMMSAGIVCVECDYIFSSFRMYGIHNSLLLY